MGTSGAQPDEPAYRRLERFLLEPGSEPPDIDLLRGSKLTGYAYTRLRPGHPLRARLETAFVLATAQHAAVRAELLPLLRAWRGAGIEVLVFKGFYLAECVYEEPAQRHYSDVDILMWPEQARLASRLAQELGWLESWYAEQPGSPHGYRAADWQGHEVMHLDSSRIRLRLDVHRRILHHRFSWAGLQERFTREAWSASRELDWGDGAVIRVLQPLDSLLIGLVLNRCWSGDDWQLRPHDFLDFAALVQKGGVTKVALTERARELGCARTLGLFLKRCDAFERRLELRPPSRTERRRWNLAIMPERGDPGLERSLSIALRGPGTLVDMLRELPGVLRILLMLRRQGVQPLVAQVNALIPANASPSDAGTLSYREWQRLRRGVRRSLALLGYRLTPNSLPLTLALFAALRRRGCPVVLCGNTEHSARRNAGYGEGDEAQVWLELDGKRLEDGTRPQHEVS